MVAADWQTVSRGNSIPPYSALVRPIEKSAQDDRDYRLIKLDNGLLATVIHDAKADKAAASLNVAIGHLCDPDDMPGLAHFCEHLLFMGTELFPRENDYSEFLAKNNGSANAFTAPSNTNYFFNVSTHALEPALTRFAAFFHCPLFASSCTSRELNAVHSEHKKNHQHDMWRIFQLNKHLSKDGHPWRKFGTGHRDSLSQAGRELKAKNKLNGNGKESSSRGSSSVATSLAPTPLPSRAHSPAPSMMSIASEVDADGGSVGRETRRRLVEWWNKEYCASRMQLCVIGNESLDDLADLVSRLFSPVPNRGGESLPIIKDHPFGENEIGTLVSVKTIMTFHAVEISFPLSYRPALWRYKPDNFLAHFVGHEGPGSLHSYLKAKGWCTQLSSGGQNLGREFGMFKATIHLTEDGFRNWRDVTLALFKYLSLLRASPLPAWYQKEIATISAIRFRFQEKLRPDSYAQWVSDVMSWPVPPELAIAGPNLVSEWDPEGQGEKEMRETLDSLRVFNGRVVLMARGDEHEKVASGAWSKEPWYGTEYRVVKLDEEYVKEAEGPNDIKELFLPGPNEFIPTNLDVAKREVDQPMKRPHLIRESPLSTLWHKKDDQFWVPKGHLVINFRSPFANTSPRASVMTHLYADLVNDSLTEFAYDADLAGLKYSFSARNNGFMISLSGYNDKLSVLARHVMQAAKDLVIRADRLNVMKEELKRTYANFFFGPSYSITDHYARLLLTHDSWTLTEQLKEIPAVTPEDIQAHISKLLGNVNMQLLVVGNIYKEEAIHIAELAEGIFSAAVPESSVIDRALILQPGSNFIWKAPVPNPNEANSALTYYLHVGSSTVQRNRVLCTLLIQMLSDPAFNVLRTREQLGYVVSCGRWVLSGATHVGMRIVVQSERGPTYLEERVERFLESMETVILNMDDKEFTDQKAGLEKKWREKHKNLGEELSSYWPHLESGFLDFCQAEKDADLLETVTKQDVLDLFMSRIHPSATMRAKLAVHMYSQKPRPKLISSEAAQKFEAAVLASGMDLTDGTGGWRDELGSRASVDQFIAYWKTTLGDEAQAQELLGVIPALAEEFPTEPEDESQMRREGAEYIEDMKLFKQKLPLSDEPKPLVEWGDLPVSRL